MHNDNETEGETIARLRAIESDIVKIKEICKVPSISYGILHHGRIILRKSIGLRDVESNLEANSDTAYRLASCSKPITAAVIALLVDRGKLSWDDTIHSHLPGFRPLEDSNLASKATIKDALMHSTGLANPVAVMMGPGGSISIRGKQHLSMVNALPTSNVEAGQRFRNWWYYSVAAFGLVSLIVEAVTSCSFAEFVREQLFEPLGMSQTLFSTADSSNVALPYVQTKDGKWSRIFDRFEAKDSSPLLASIGLRSSVNDLLAFLSAVMDRYDHERSQEPTSGLQEQSKSNPLRGIRSMWKHWWTRPISDGFKNKTAYTLGWFRTSMPSAAVGLLSYNFHRYTADDKPYLKYILGKETPTHTLYGHNGIANGAVATMYLLPKTHSAVVALSNAANAGDAAESTAQVLLQALFDLKPRIDIIESTVDARDRCLQAHASMIEAWRQGRDEKKYTGHADHYLGTYIGLNVSRIDIIRSKTSATGLAVTFDLQNGLQCDLEPYNNDALSFLPMDHDELLRKAMIDWDYHRVGIFEFVRRDGNVVGLWWQWDQYDYAGLWVKTSPETTDQDKAAIIQEFGAFRKPKVAELGIEENASEGNGHDLGDATQAINKQDDVIQGPVVALDSSAPADKPRNPSPKRERRIWRCSMM